MKTKKTITHSNDDRLKWWREARFGMFIHFGLYSQAAGAWNGGRFDNFLAEWLMATAAIPHKEYSAKLAAAFNPTAFSARKIVSLAKSAGMKYLVITAKHHDGFAMFDSAHPYNVVTGTPYGKDPMEALARECHKAGIKFCFYYSQDQDWQDPDGSGNNWDYPDAAAKDFDRYLEDKVKPQLRELLTRYGPIGLLWFDTPISIDKKQSEELKRFVRSLQPDCLVSGRVGHGVGDYGSLGDNEFARGNIQGDWETPATMNDNWGFSSADHNWKSVGDLLSLLAGSAAYGANYLLNIGPDPSGAVPAPSVGRLKAIGRWLKVHGEAIYGSSAGPFDRRLEWGWCTSKPGLLYLLIDHWPSQGKFFLPDLGVKIKSATLLGKSQRPLTFRQTPGPKSGVSELEIDIPRKAPDRQISVIRLDLRGDVAKQQRKDWISVQGASLLSADGTASGTLTIINPFRKACLFDLSGEGGESLDVEIQAQVQVAAGRKATVPFIVRQRTEVAGPSPVRLSVSREGMRIGGSEFVCYAQAKAVPIHRLASSPDLACRAKPWPGLPVLTRDTADWLTLASTDKGMEWRGPDDLSFTAQIGWHDAICLRLEVRDDFVSPAPAGERKRSPWQYDSVEIRIAAVPQAKLADLGGYHPALPRLVLIVNPELGAKSVKCEVSDYSKDVAAAVEFHSKKTANGYLMEGRIEPKPGTGLKPCDGLHLVMDVSINDKDNHPPRAVAKSRMSLFCRAGTNPNWISNWQLCRLDAQRDGKD
jgi:alpha-L-fucosidase